MARSNAFMDAPDNLDDLIAASPLPARELQELRERIEKAVAAGHYAEGQELLLRLSGSIGAGGRMRRAALATAQEERS